MMDHVAMVALVFIGGAAFGFCLCALFAVNHVNQDRGDDK